MMDLLTDGPEKAGGRRVVLAHGAGAAMDTPFMSSIAEGVAARGLQVVRFEFPYMAERRASGRKRPPDREPVLLDTWRRVVADLGDPTRLVIGGKSMGGRMASLVADELGVGGLVCLGYPFHPPGKPDRLRTEHLAALRTPTLICQGERDPFGTRVEVDGYGLSSSIRLHWLVDGEHSFKPRKTSGRTEADNLANAVDAIAGFVAAL
jgi:predicted alpha/beta-hydrolase family hydrolase